MVSLLVRKHFRECQRPVEETVPRRQCGRMVQKALSNDRAGQPVDAADGRIARRKQPSKEASVLPEPACTRDPASPTSGQAETQAHGASQVFGLFRDDRRRVVWLKGQLQACACGVLEYGRQIRIRKQR